MLNENLQEQFQQENNSKPNFVNQIDDIINKYKSQLDQLKTNSKHNNEDEHTIQTIPIINTATLQSKTLSTLIESPELQNEIDNVKMTESAQFSSSDLSKEIQNDNIKLQSALTAEKLKVIQLNSKIENYEKELDKSKQEIIELQNQLENKDNEFNEQLNNINNDINSIKEENILNINIIQRFFELFNKNIDLFNKSKIIACDRNTRISYLENDYEGNNQKMSIFVVNNLDILINKLLQDNKELFEQLIEAKKILDEQNNIQREISVINDIKEENLILKKQLQNLINENERFKNDNLRLKNNIIDLNNYINNNKNRNINNNNYNLNKEYMNKNIHDNSRHINYNKRQRINSYQENHYITNNNERNLSKSKDSYNSSRNIKSNFMVKNNNSNNRVNNNDYNDNYNNNLYCKTDENRRINNNENQLNINNDNNNDNQRIVETGFEKPIEQLKKKIMLLEQQIKSPGQ